MKQCVYVGNHKPTEEQLKELKERYGVQDVIVMNPKPLSPTIESVKEATTIIEEIISKLDKPTIAWIQFPQIDLRLTYLWAKANLAPDSFNDYKRMEALKNIEAFVLPMTERKVREEVTEDGCLKKTSIFQHKGFVTVLS